MSVITVLSHAPVTQTDSMYFYVFQVNLWECVNFWQYKYLNKTWSNLTGNTNTVFSIILLSNYKNQVKIKHVLTNW